MSRVYQRIEHQTIQEINRREAKRVNRYRMISKSCDVQILYAIFIADIRICPVEIFVKVQRL